MHYARTVGERNVRIAHHVIRLFAETEFLLSERIKRLVFQPFVFRSFLLPEDFVAAFSLFVRLFISEHGGKQAFGKNTFFAAFVHFHAHVIERGIHAERDVGRQRPGRSRPGENIQIFFAFHFEFHVRRFLFYVFIPLRHFVRRKRGAAARAIRHDFMPLIQQTFFVHFFQRPPLRFDIIVVIRNVRIIHIAPVPHAIGHLFPFRGILPYGFFTFADERLDPVRLDLRFMIEAQFLFHFQFHGKPVRIPARFTKNVIALHRAVSRNDVFHYAR